MISQDTLTVATEAVQNIVAKAVSDDVWKAALSTLQVVSLALLAGIFGVQRRSQQDTKKATDELQKTVNGSLTLKQREVDMLRQQLIDCDKVPKRLIRRKDDAPDGGA